jgi:hypothetical protein
MKTAMLTSKVFGNRLSTETLAVHNSKASSIDLPRNNSGILNFDQLVKSRRKMELDRDIRHFLQ